MVILVVRLWYENDSQLFDTKAAETDGNQMPFIACPYHLCVPITSVMKTTGTAWQERVSLSSSTKLSRPSDQNQCSHTVSELCVLHADLRRIFFLPCMRVYFVYTLCVNVCLYVRMSLSFNSVVLRRYVLIQSLKSQVAPGVWEQLASCWRSSVRCTHKHRYIHTVCKRLYVCLFIPFLTLMHMYARAFKLI